MCLLFPSLAGHAMDLSEIRRQQEETRKQIDLAEQQRQQAEDVLDGLKGEAASLGSTYQSYANKLAGVNAQITEAANAMANTSQEMDRLAKELEQAREDEIQQREAMKIHIQYMYENQTGKSMLTYLCESGSMSNFVKRMEYAGAIMDNDARLIEAYEELQITISGKTDALKAKQEELAGYQKTLSAKQEELDDLTQEARGEYDAKSGEVSAAQMSVDEYEAKLEEFRKREKALEQQYAQAQIELAKKLEEEGGGEQDTSGALSGYTQDDLTLMAAIIQAEAGGEIYAGKLAVGSVIMNRIMDSRFPNTLQGVIYQPMQFQPVRDGHLDLILARGPNEECYQAARQVLGGYRSGNWLFFMTPYWANYYGITGYTVIGNHAFFYKWGAN